VFAITSLLAQAEGGECTAEGYKNFHDLHDKDGKLGLVPHECNDGDEECLLKCEDRSESGYGAIKCEIGSKYGDYRYSGVLPCGGIYCKKYGGCRNCKGHSGKACATEENYTGLCSSSSKGNKCNPVYNCKNPKEKGEKCISDIIKGNMYRFYGYCSPDEGNELKCMKCDDILGSVIEKAPGKSSDYGTYSPTPAEKIAKKSQCKKNGFIIFVESYKKKFVGGFKLSRDCKNGSTKCQLECRRKGYERGSSSGTVNCENGIYWFDEMPKSCRKSKML